MMGEGTKTAKAFLNFLRPYGSVSNATVARKFTAILGLSRIGAERYTALSSNQLHLQVFRSVSIIHSHTRTLIRGQCMVEKLTLEIC